MLKALPSWLDVKLGARMILKHPGLTAVAGIAIAVAIALGAVFDIAAGVVDAPLPLDEGDRIVAIEQFDAARNDQEERILHDFVTWREELRTVRELGAYRTVERNLTVPGTPAQLVRVAEITASGFQLARVPPVLGRTLGNQDERPGAAPVLVVGFEVWRARFDSDPAIVGRRVHLGGLTYTVAGVMPDGFGFPLNHQLWVPLRANPLEYQRGEGPDLTVFARLAPGATIADAQAELTAIGARASAAFPATHHNLRPRVLPYTAQLFDDMEGWEVTAIRVLLALLLAVLCVNVAVLFYARTAARHGELAVRAALGASRPRIVTQLFMEALLLSAGAAAVGLIVAALSVEKLNTVIASVAAPMGGAPFWLHLRVLPSTVAYAFGLAVVAALVVGVVPGLSATGRRLQSRLGRHAAAVHLGRTWNLLIVAQVAFAAAVLPTTVLWATALARYGIADPGFAADEFLAASVAMENEDKPGAQSDIADRVFRSRYASRLTEAGDRLRAAPEVSAVTFASDLPGQEPTVKVRMEGTGEQRESPATHAARSSSVADNFFEAFGARLLAGRMFRSGTATEAEHNVVVNRAFVRDVLGGGGAVGRQLTYVEGYRTGGMLVLPAGTELGRAYEIVGVVDDVPARATQPGEVSARIYHALVPGTVYPVKVALHTRGEPSRFARRFEDIVTSVDPSLQLREALPLAEVIRVFQRGLRLGALALTLTTVSVLLLCAAGIYALTSFTVTQRRKEIGIRTALGSSPGQVIRAIAGHAARRVIYGLALGTTVAVVAAVATRSGGPVREWGPLAVLPVAAVIALVGVFAALGPARRGLRIEPAETLKAET